MSHDLKEFFMGMIRGEYVYVPEEGANREATRVAAREGAGEGVGREDAREDEGKEDVLSFLNPSGDGMEIEMFDDHGKTNTMTNDNCKQTTMERYIYLAFGDMKGICIHVLMTFSFFGPLD
jgi:hypothetical protein